MLSWKWYTGNLDWLRGSTIFLARSGSHAYGTNLPTSDEDFRGIAIPPKRYFHGFVDRFEQAEVKDPDVVIYDVRKFFALAADCNPNIIESLFVDESDWIIATRYWTDVVHRFRDAFLSKRAMHTFSGYALAQLKRIRSHRRYLLSPPRKHPDRADFGLPDAPTLSRDQFGVIEARIRKTEDTLGGDGFTKDRIEDVDASLVETAVRDLRLSPNLIPIIVAERKYGAAMREWKQYETWKTNRNDKRAELERDHGFDCYLDDTEFLTERGWLRFDEISSGDRLATLNQATGCLEMHRPTERVEKSYSGPIHFLETRDTSCAVTPNHRMWLSTAHRSKVNGFSTKYDDAVAVWSICPVETLATGRSSHFHARVSTAGAPSAFAITDELLIAVGAYVSEGCVGKRRSTGPSVLRFSQKTGGRLVPFMDRLAETWTVRRYEYPRKGRRSPCTEITWTCAGRPEIASIVAWCGEGSLFKGLPPWILLLSQEQARLLLAVLMAGDGTNRKYSGVYYTASKRLADDVQSLCLVAGYTSQIWGPYPSKTGSAMFQVYVAKKTATHVVARGTQSHIRVEAVERRRIVCFTVPNEILITRRGGKVAIQGNTKHGMHLVRLMRMAIEILRDGKVIVKRPDAEELLAIRNGAWTFDALMEWATTTEAELKTYYDTSTLPREPDRRHLDGVLTGVVEMFLGYPYLGPP